ncbi:hypothetical protein KFL_006090030 [Klebsormidium nitens]|uniref:Uncharacterized protein n=1 Tax=Klebsormidium nitens TaxID=105231 RepID=A0A1Y1INH4_KLENI|nr:hypothetical protein KFL_006090030 [Klebsormidium nitens]|eukprot:GAQ90177.1 hypothetical protein KFL_006090030 [Klebsormidium nitens]
MADSQQQCPAPPNIVKQIWDVFVVDGEHYSATRIVLGWFFAGWLLGLFTYWAARRIRFRLRRALADAEFDAFWESSKQSSNPIPKERSNPSSTPSSTPSSNPIPNLSSNPIPNPSSNPIPNPSSNPIPNPSSNPILNPSNNLGGLMLE